MVMSAQDLGLSPPLQNDSTPFKKAHPYKKARIL